MKLAEASSSVQSVQESPAGSERVRILAIIVLYKMHAQDSSSLRTLLAAAKAAKGVEVEVLLWDNTPGGQDAGEIPAEVTYLASPDNPGLARAYNYALAQSIERGYRWLLTLDQDSVLPVSYFSQVSQVVRGVQSNADVAAVVPLVTGDGRVVSPYYHVLSAFPRWFAAGDVGIPDTAVTAVNSASLLRVDAVQLVGGYDLRFPLDASDLSLYQRLHLAGKRVYVSGDIEVHHEFSILNPGKRMSLGRYRSMLLDECAFWDTYMGPLARLERMLRLTLRSLRDLLRGSNADFRRITQAELWRRLTHRRKQRIAHWNQWSGTRILQQKMTSAAERR